MCHPVKTEGKVTLLLCPAPHLSPSRAGCCSTRAAAAHNMRTRSAERSFRDEEGWQSPQLHQEGLEDRSNLDNNQAGALMGIVVLCSGIARKEKGWRWGKLMSRFSILDSRTTQFRSR